MVGEDLNVQFRDVNSEFTAKIENTFVRKTIWQNTTIYEMPNIIAFLNPDKMDLTVRLWKKLSKNDIPSFLFEYKPSGGQCPIDDNIFNL